MGRGGGGKRKKGRRDRGSKGGKGGKRGPSAGNDEDEDFDEDALEDVDPEAKRAKTGTGGNDRSACDRNVWKEDSNAWDLSSPSFEAFYKDQRICPEEDWTRFLETLRTGLPAAIRVNRTRRGAEALCARLRELRDLCGGDPERECYAPYPLEWYPHGCAWQWSALERRVIKKDRRHAQLKEYLWQRERRGLISRQEAVSMLPPLFLEVEPDHVVLDMCAAPGSKTSQLLEAMHWPRQGKDGVTPEPKGLVLANELQWRRANMLAHQVQRLGSPCAAIVNMDAQFFPELMVPADGGAAREPFRFDRVLCDVPCSGDGTMRKTPYIWKSWTFRDGMSLHIRQLNILNRGLDLLRVGGRLVYSTCSFNPLENEAVVAAALLRQRDSVALAPPPAAVDDKLQAAHGLQTWLVPHPGQEGTYFEDYKSVPHALKEGKHKVLPSMFPPPDADGEEIRAAVRAHCRRMLPHLMDTGGFFVAVFVKHAELSPSAKMRREARAEARREERVAAAAAAAAGTAAAEEDVSQAAEEGAGATPQPLESAAAEQPQRQALRRITKEYHLAKDALGADGWQELVEFYGLDPAIAPRLVVRQGSLKEIFLLSEAAQRLLLTETKLPTRMVLCGVVAFRRSGSHHVRACPWKLAQEGLPAVSVVGLKRQLIASRAFLQRLLAERELTLPELRAAVAAGDLAGLEAVVDHAGHEMPTALEEAGSWRPGSVAIELRDSDASGEGTNLRVSVAATFSDEALELDVSPDEAQALREDLCGQPSVEDILGAVGATVDAEGETDEEQDEAVTEDLPGTGGTHAPDGADQ